MKFISFLDNSSKFCAVTLVLLPALASLAIAVVNAVISDDTCGADDKFVIRFLRLFDNIGNAFAVSIVLPPAFASLAIPFTKDDVVLSTLPALAMLSISAFNSVPNCPNPCTFPTFELANKIVRINPNDEMFIIRNNEVLYNEGRDRPGGLPSGGERKGERICKKRCKKRLNL